ncbi:TonB-dependent receptor [Polaribacter sp. Z014]|uniref:SusC/RagA family TonB-linked outer membrane protein n=1 Tax=Polaribacter sp. Z014 TaxID=2927126 RepID=UPI0020211C59|nr:TonB-dependent receptor [Polaribacter sp. Z014]
MQAQTTSIKGVVTGDGQLLPGVSVLVKGTTNGTVTDFDGNFKIRATPNSVLLFSYLGFAIKEIKVGTKTTINVILKSDVDSLDEIVVVGYGTQKKKEVTGAVAQISSEEIGKMASQDLGATLQGQIAGVNVTASSGAPGSDSNILIRGLSSVTGNSSPLYVVDGIPYSSDPKLSMSEIESIDILKDAASSAIYGTRGSGGVILITTKKGKIGQMKISVDGYRGIQNITSGTNLVNVEEDLYVTFLSKNTLNGTTYGNSWTPIEYNPQQLTNNSDLRDIVENDNATIENYSLSISGGKKGLSYNVVGNLFSQDGMIINSGYDRFNLRANTQFNKGNWKVNTGLGFRIENQEYAAYNLILDAYKFHPYQDKIDPNQETIETSGPGNSVEALNRSNLAQKFQQTDVRDGNQFNGNINAEYKINDYLKFTSRAGIEYGNDKRVRINPLFKAYDGDGNVIPTSTRSGTYNYSSSATKKTWDNSLDFNKKFGDHQIKALLLYSSEKYTFTSFYAQKFDLLSNDITVLNGATLDPAAGSGTGWGQDKTTSLIGMLGRLQYNYKGKYLFSASVRRDGSSRFSEENRWGIFPSASAGWNVSDENFFSPIKDVVNSLKLRGSYGTTGNQGFLDYSNAATITLSQDYVFGAEENDNLALGATQTAFANKNIKWETSKQTNIGFDFGFLKNRLKFSGDFYKTKKEDMLFPLLLPPTTGAGLNKTVILNVGDMENTGLEFALNYRHKGDLTWSAGINYSHNENIVTKMSGANKIAYLEGSKVVNSNSEDLVSVLAEGYTAGSFFLIPTDGIIKTEEELNEYKNLFPGANLGDLKYIDALTVDTDGDGILDAGDGVITNDDRVNYGSGTPSFEMGLNFSLEYKNFDFYMQWYTSQGAEILNGNKAFTYKYATNKDLVYQWTPQNTSSNIPTNRGRDHYNYRGYTDYWLEDGSFIRLRNVNLGYTITNSFLKKAKINKLRIYITAQNPLTFTKYTGFDPEVGNNGLSTKGIDKGNYPVSSQYKMGIQLDF